MTDDEADAKADSEHEGAADYEKWKYMWSPFPFRYAFTGLAVAGVAGAVAVERAWDGPFRWLAVVLSMVFIGGTLRLFYDIPQRRLSRFSQAFLSFGISVVLVVVLVTFFS